MNFFSFNQTIGAIDQSTAPSIQHVSLDARATAEPFSLHIETAIRELDTKEQQSYAGNGQAHSVLRLNSDFPQRQLEIVTVGSIDPVSPAELSDSKPAVETRSNLAIQNEPVAEDGTSESFEHLSLSPFANWVCGCTFDKASKNNPNAVNAVISSDLELQETNPSQPDKHRIDPSSNQILSSQVGDEIASSVGKPTTHYKHNVPDKSDSPIASSAYNARESFSLIAKPSNVLPPSNSQALIENPETSYELPRLPNSGNLVKPDQSSTRVSTAYLDPQVKSPPILNDRSNLTSDRMTTDGDLHQLVKQVSDSSVSTDNRKIEVASSSESNQVLNGLPQPAVSAQFVNDITTTHEPVGLESRPSDSPKQLSAPPEATSANAINRTNSAELTRPHSTIVIPPDHAVKLDPQLNNQDNPTPSINEQQPNRQTQLTSAQQLPTANSSNRPHFNQPEIPTQIGSEMSYSVPVRNTNSSVGSPDLPASEQLPASQTFLPVSNAGISGSRPSSSMKPFKTEALFDRGTFQPELMRQRETGYPIIEPVAQTEFQESGQQLQASLQSESVMNSDFDSTSFIKPGGKENNSNLSESILRQVTQSITASLIAGASNSDDSRLTIRLDPPELGELQIDFDNTRDGIKISIRTDNVAARTLLDQQITQLATRLEESGVNLQGLDVSQNQSQSGNEREFQKNQKTTSTRNNTGQPELQNNHRPLGQIDIRA